MFPAMSGQQHTRHSLDLPLDEDVGGITERSGHPRLGLILEQRRVIEPWPSDDTDLNWMIVSMT